MTSIANNFTDQKQRVATSKDVQLPWGGAPNGKRFRCYLCGHRFSVGEKWRWVFGAPVKTVNFFVCDSCDGDDVLDRWRKIYDEAYKVYWWKH